MQIWLNSVYRDVRGCVYGMRSIESIGLRKEHMDKIEQIIVKTKPDCKHFQYLWS